jgi:hypothetical protein
MKAVHKYQFTQRLMDFQMPQGAIVRSVQDQHGVVTMWAEVDTDKLLSGRRFTVYGTGHEVPPHAKYVGTVQQGAFVWHVFEL